MWNCPMWFRGSPWFGGYWNMTPWIFNIILLAIVVLFIWHIISRYNIFHPSTRDTAIDILRRKYAEGELTREEFQKKLEDLKN
ncbi:SHOCT domain-containing protein [bacterium]|nr:SHOCT domain-containing protein [bacterium]